LNNLGQSEKHSNSFSNSTNVFTIELGKTTYEIYQRIIRPDYTAKRVSETLKLGRSTVKYHINKLEDMRLIKCINSKDRIKFYEKTVDVFVSPGKRKGSYLLSSNNLGRVSKYGSLQPNDARYKKIIINGDSRHEKTRVHAVTFKVPITKKWKDYYKQIQWDKISKPRGRFEQYTKKEKVKNVGDVSYKWIHTNTKDTLMIYLPMLYFLPHELDETNTDHILTDYAWKATKHFVRKYHVGVERFLEIVGKYHVALPATKKQQEYLKQNGTLEIPTPNGKIMLDDSMKDGGEVEADNIKDIKLYSEVREDLLKPAEIYAIKDNINTLASQLSNVKEKTQTHENFLKDFTATFTQYLEQDKNKWQTQKEFNESVKEYMVRTDSKIESIMFEMGLGKRPTKQMQLDIYDKKSGEIGYV
jgi:DNA-binding transcriptional ArsR family regulator